MANYNLLINSTFNPISFEEFMKPIAMYEEAYKEQEDALAELSDKASVWEGMIDKSDPIYKEYSRFLNDLEVQRNILNNQGLAGSARADMLKLKSRFNKEIVPMEKAYERRQKYIDAQWEDRRKYNGAIAFTKDASTYHVSDFMNGKNPQYSQVSLDDLYKESATGMAAISSQYFTEPELRELNKQYYIYRTENGMTSEQAMEKLKEDNSVVKQFADAMRSKYGYAQYDDLGQRGIDNAIAQGIIAGSSIKRADALTQNMNFQSDAQRDAFNFQKQQYYDDLAMRGRVYDKETGKWKYVKDNDLSIQQGEAYRDAGIQYTGEKGGQKKVPRPIVDKNKAKEVHKGTSGYVFKPSGENNTLTEQSNGIYTYGEEQIKDKVPESIRKRIIKVVGKDTWNSPNFRLFFNKETKNYVLLEDAHTYTAEAWNNEQQTGNAAGNEY